MQRGQSDVHVQDKLSPKLKNPGRFIISCYLGKIKIENALCDLRVSVNLMSRYVFTTLGVGNLKSIKISLQLADGSVRISISIFEDLLVRVDIFPSQLILS
jgi:hypothetical protein